MKALGTLGMVLGVFHLVDSIYMQVQGESTYQIGSSLLKAAGLIALGVHLRRRSEGS